MPLFTRRKMLQLAAFGVAAKMFPFSNLTAFAQSAGDYKALVCIFLFGGNDGDNTVVPISGPARTDYSSGRSSIAIPSGSLLPIGTVNHSTYGQTPYGLHPSLAPVHALSQNLAIVANVGTLVKPLTKDQYLSRSEPRPQSLFSHSDQQEQMQTASLIFPSTTGWGGRLSDRIRSMNAPSTFPAGVSVAGSSLLLASTQSQPARLSGNGGLRLSGSGGTSGRARTLAMQEMLDVDIGFSLAQQAYSTFSNGFGVATEMNAALDASTLTTVFPNSSLGRQLEHVAKLIEARAQLGMKRQIFFCSTGGYDTHDDQVNRHQGILAGLGAAMAAFYQATEDLGVANSVTTFSESDFGRTFQPNPNGGTDHAWGSHQLVLGGAVNAGIYGNFPTLQIDGPDSADRRRGRWIPTTGLDQYAATLATWFGLPTGDLNAVFPNLRNFPTNNLGFV